MSSINPARSVVIVSAAVLALVLFAPQSAIASDSGITRVANDSGIEEAVFVGVLLLEAADIGVGIYDLRAASRKDRIGKPAAALQLLLTVPQVVVGSMAIAAWSGPEGNASLVLIGLAVSALPLALTIYSLYVLLSPEPKATLDARLERGIGIELPAPRVAGIERVMFTPTVISAAEPRGWGTPRALNTDNSAGSRQLTPGVALAFRF